MKMHRLFSRIYFEFHFFDYRSIKLVFVSFNIIIIFFLLFDFGDARCCAYMRAIDGVNLFSVKNRIGVRLTKSHFVEHGNGPFWWPIIGGNLGNRRRVDNAYSQFIRRLAQSKRRHKLRSKLAATKLSSSPSAPIIATAPIIETSKMHRFIDDRIVSENVDKSKFSLPTEYIEIVGFRPLPLPSGFPFSAPPKYLPIPAAPAAPSKPIIVDSLSNFGWPTIGKIPITTLQRNSTTNREQYPQIVLSTSYGYRDIMDSSEKAIASPISSFNAAILRKPYEVMNSIKIKNNNNNNDNNDNDIIIGKPKIIADITIEPLDHSVVLPSPIILPAKSNITDNSNNNNNNYNNNNNNKNYNSLPSPLLPTQSHTNNSQRTVLNNIQDIIKSLKIRDQGIAIEDDDDGDEEIDDMITEVGPNRSINSMAPVSSRTPNYSIPSLSPMPSSKLKSINRTLPSPIKQQRRYFGDDQIGLGPKSKNYYQADNYYYGYDSTPDRFSRSSQNTVAPLNGEKNSVAPKSNWRTSNLSFVNFDDLYHRNRNRNNSIRQSDSFQNRNESLNSSMIHSVAPSRVATNDNSSEFWINPFLMLDDDEEKRPESRLAAITNFITREVSRDDKKKKHDDDDDDDRRKKLAQNERDSTNRVMRDLKQILSKLENDDDFHHPHPHHHHYHHRRHQRRPTIDFGKMERMLVGIKPYGRRISMPTAITKNIDNN